MERFENGRRGAADGGFERGEQELIGAHRPRKGVAGHALNPFLLPEDEPGLRATHEFVAAREHEICPLLEGFGEGRFVR